jgi:Tfp pilus assembly protein PilX
MMKKRLKNEEGMILVMVLVLMMVIAILGIMAINMSTIDIQIFGNQKRSTEAFELAQGGSDLSIPIIENTLADGALPTLPNTIGLATDLEDEIMGTTVSNDDINNLPDVTITMANGAKALVDIDRLYSQAVSGGAMEFAGGYEGVGAGTAGGGAAILYRVRSEGFR